MATETEDYSPASHYDRVTDAWRLLLGEELHYGVFENGDEPLEVATGVLTAKMLAGAALEPGMDVLDVGCGIGTQACRMAEEFGAQVLGITTSEVGVASATERARVAGVSGARFEVRDGTDNGLPDGSFDRVWALESSHLMRDRAALIREAARVLRPGGRVILCDLIRHREIPFLEVRRRRDEFAVLREAFGDAHMLEIAYYAGGFEVAGLEVIRTEDLTAATLPTFDRWRANAKQHGAAVESTIGARGLEAFVQSCDILESLWRDGTFGYGLVVARKPG